MTETLENWDPKKRRAVEWVIGCLWADELESMTYEERNNANMLQFIADLETRYEELGQNSDDVKRAVSWHKDFRNVQKKLRSGHRRY